MLSSLNWILTRELITVMVVTECLLWYLNLIYHDFVSVRFLRRTVSSVSSFWSLRRMQTKQVDCVSLVQWPLFQVSCPYLLFVQVSPHKVSFPTAACILRSLSACVTVLIYPFLLGNMGLPPGSVGRICLPIQERRFKSLDWEDPWSKWQPSCILATRAPRIENVPCYSL